MFGLDRVGKTSLINRFLFNKYDAQYKQTIEDLYRGDITYNEQKCDLTIIDMGGYYQFPAMRKLAIQKSDGFLLVYSIDSVPSFEEAKRLYNIIVEIKGSSDVPVLLVGNKADISIRRISKIEVCTSINSWGKKVQRIEASAKSDLNVCAIFHNLIQMIDERKHEQVQMNTLHDMTRYSTRKFSSVLSISFPLINVKTVHHTVKTEIFEKRKRRRTYSESYEYKTNLLFSTLSPILPPSVTKYITRYIINKQ